MTQVMRGDLPVLDRDIVVVRFANGATALVEAVRPPGERPVGDITKPADFRKVLPSIAALCSELDTVIDAVSPQKAAVKFGFSLSLEADGLVALFCKASTEATFEVTFEWSRNTEPR